ncbi:MAG: Spi family protease inhibitor [Bacteroidales bacterium]|nr:Spi family protease inhibitor [Bacteroidales bacterium]
MNAKTYLLIALSIILTLSCQKVSVEIAESSYDNPIENDILTIDTKASLPTDYYVGEDDIASYVHYKQLCGKEQKKQRPEIIPLGIDDGVQAYAINYDEGWEIVSADKRIRPVLAQSSEGSFSPKESTTSEGAFLNSVLKSIASMQKDGKDIVTGNENAEKNILFWKLITCEIDANPHTKAVNPVGYYTLDHVEHATTTYRTVNHLLSTAWYQESYTQGYDYDLNDWYFSGTGNVAASQLLTYLYNEKGFNLSTPSGLGSFSWSSINRGLLVDYIYHATNSTYYNRVIWTEYNNLSETISSFGVDNSIGSNSGGMSAFKSTIDNSLGNEMPVLGVVTTAVFNGDPIYEYHQNYFLIDAYKMYRDDTIYYYKYVGPDGTEMPGYLERRYGSPYYAMYGMRWCTYNCSDDAWYAIDSSLGLNYSLLSNSAIIHDFSNTN